MDAKTYPILFDLTAHFETAEHADEVRLSFLEADVEGHIQLIHAGHAPLDQAVAIDPAEAAQSALNEAVLDWVLDNREALDTGGATPPEDVLYQKWLAFVAATKDL